MNRSVYMTILYEYQMLSDSILNRERVMINKAFIVKTLKQYNLIQEKLD